MASSILQRKRDLVYFVFFCIHLPVMFCMDTTLLETGLYSCWHVWIGVDLAPLWPAAIKPAYLDTIRTYYITTFRDQFFSSPPAWFTAYIWLELFYHVPLSLWAIGALLRSTFVLHCDDLHLISWLDDPLVPVHLLIFAVQTGMSTLTCCVDFMNWSEYLANEKIALAQLYVPYLVLGKFLLLSERVAQTH